MTRIDDRLHIHRKDGLIILVDRETNTRISFPVAQAREVLRVLAYLATDPNGE
jgi:hypothetical protein